MLEKTLHTGNVAAAFGVLATTASDLTVCGGAATAISGASSVLAIFKKDDATHALVEQMGAPFMAAMEASPLGDDAKKLIPQLMEQFPVTENDIAAGNLVAAQVAGIVRTRIEAAEGLDPALTQTALLDAYRAILTLTLDPVMDAPGGLDAMQAAIAREELQRSTKQNELLNAIHANQEVDMRLKAAGVSEEAIFEQAQKILSEVTGLDQAWKEIIGFVERQTQLNAKASQNSNISDLDRAVAELSREGKYRQASKTIEDALEQIEGEKLRLLDSGAEVALLERDTAKAAALLVRKADLDAGGAAQSDHILAIKESRCNADGTDGSNLDWSLAADIGRLALSRARTIPERRRAGSALGISLGVLGAREDGTKHLEQAVSVLTDNLDISGRDRFPMEWANTQVNLGIAHKNLGEREQGTTHKELAIQCFKAALKVFTRQQNPTEWAMVQMNLGNAYKNLGRLEAQSTNLTKAVEAYLRALEVITREQSERDWLMTQMNLANARRHLGNREPGTNQLTLAKDTLTFVIAAISYEENPILWAKANASLANVEKNFFDKNGSLSHLNRATELLARAKEIFIATGATRFVQMAESQSQDIDLRRAKQ